MAPIHWHIGAAIVVLAASVIAVDFSWQPMLGTISDDSPSYIIMAHVFSPWTDTTAAFRTAYENYVHPPLFPLLLGWLNLHSDLHFAHAFVALCFGASALLAYAWLLRETERAPLALLLTLLLVIMPLPWSLMLSVISENLYIALSLGFLLAWRPDADGRLSARRAVIAGLLLAALIVTRSIGIAMVLAVIAHLLLRRPGIRQSLPMVAVVLGGLVAEGIWQAVKPDTAGHYASDFSGMTGLLASSDGRILFFNILLENLITHWGSFRDSFFIFGTGISPWRIALVGVFALLAFIGLLRDGLRGRVYALYTLAYGAIITIWPYPSESARFLYPLYPMFFLASVTGLQTLARRLDSVTTMALTLTLVLLMIANTIPSVAFLIARSNTQFLNTPVNEIAELYKIPNLIQARKTAAFNYRTLNDAREMGEYLPEDVVILAVKPSIITAMSGRLCLPLPQADDDELRYLRLLRSSKADLVYLSRITNAAHPEPFAMLPVLLRVTEPVWARAADTLGIPDAMLLKIDYAKLGNRISELETASNDAGTLTQP